MSGAPTPDRPTADRPAANAPWWSSDGAGVDPDEDPLAAHLAARGLHAVDDDADRTSTDDPDPSPDADGPATGPDDATSPHPPGICGVCPICRGHALVQERHPEVAGHLADAARSLSRARATFAALVVAGPAPGPTRPGRADRADRADDGFRPITLDDEEGAAR